MLCEKIVGYCKDKHISLAAFEKKCGLGNGTIKNWEKSNPRIDSIKKVSKETGISISELLEDSPDC